MTGDAFSAQAAERAIISSLLSGDAKLSGYGLSRDDFADPVSRELYETMEALDAEGKATDLVTVCDRCKTGADTVAGILVNEAAVSPVFLPGHADAVREASLRRRIAEAGRALSSMAGNPEAEVSRTLTAAQEKLNGFFRGMPGKESVSLMDAALAWYRAMDGEPEPAIPTGLPFVDDCLAGGVRGSRLYVVGARPGVGKSAFGLQIALNAARMGKRVLFVTLEMDEQEIMTRILSRYTGFPGHRFERRDLSPEDWTAVARAQGEISVLPMRICTEVSTPGQLRAMAAKLRGSEGLDLVVVDYLQLLDGDRRFLNRAEEVGSISRQLRHLSQDYRIPVVAMTQFNRDSERDREAGRLPRMSESRESGAIEQDASVFLILHQPEEAQLTDKTQRALFRACREKGLAFTEVVVAKNRGAPRGASFAAFDGARMRFLPVEG